ncbi:uncharacterized protein [Ptychodera flava]|uniref:uncharacterized protein isoform X2 n=1 Tax=Ptychodera flava TaxID=63121 RepID=UPI003969C85D
MEHFLLRELIVLGEQWGLVYDIGRWDVMHRAHEQDHTIYKSFPSEPRNLPEFSSEKMTPRTALFKALWTRRTRDSIMLIAKMKDAVSTSSRSVIGFHVKPDSTAQRKSLHANHGIVREHVMAGSHCRCLWIPVFGLGMQL